MKAFFSAFDVLPGWVWALLCAGAISAQAVTGYQLNTERTAHAETRDAHAQAVATAARTALNLSEQYRATEQELRNAQDIHAAEVSALHLDLERSRAGAAAAAGRLQVAIAAAAAKARAGCAATTPADIRETAGDPIGVLADVLGRADERAGILADLAERRYIAGRACEREYDAAYKALNHDPVGESGR